MTETASTYDVLVQLGDYKITPDFKEEVAAALERSKGQLVDLYFLGGPWDVRITADFTEVNDVIKFRYELQSLGMWKVSVTPIATVRTLNEIVQHKEETIRRR